eukprot:scaffold7377_cov257-Pinguiococcus_pyrenoidosus.AAC.9
MATSPGSRKRPLPYFLASSVAAVINFPLWKASAIGQSGFRVKARGNGALQLYIEALKPPYKGVGVVVFGMTWARAAIFFGSDWGRQRLKETHVHDLLASAVPPLITSTFVQICNQPIIRASITLQDPSVRLSGPAAQQIRSRRATDVLPADVFASQANHPSTWSVIRDICRRHGVAALWHGTSAGIMKTVPKYCCAILTKDYLEDKLPPSDGTRQGDLQRSAVKAVIAGVAGAVITNPFDVIRNEMFKTNQSLVAVVRRLGKEEPQFATR